MWQVISVLLFLSFRLLDILRRQAPEILLEARSKVRRSIESDHCAHFRYCISTVFQQPCSFVETDFADEVDSRFSGDGFEFEMQIGTAHIHFPCELVSRELDVIHILLNDGHGTFQQSFIHGIERNLFRFYFQRFGIPFEHASACAHHVLNLRRKYGE